jgi:hypothetical protein
MVNKFWSDDKFIMYADGKVYPCLYQHILRYARLAYYFQVRRTRAYLDVLTGSMDGAEVAVNCLCSVRSCATCWCPDDDLANAHCGECEYRRMAAVMEELDAARDRLLDKDDKLVGHVKDIKEVEKRLRHRLLQHNAWRLISFFELCMSSPKDELYQWYAELP